MLSREPEQAFAHVLQSGNTALRAATLLGDAESVQVLLGEGADPNQETARGTPLIAAASQGDATCINILLDGGADVDGRTIAGYDDVQSSSWTYAESTNG